MLLSHRKGGKASFDKQRGLRIPLIEGRGTNIGPPIAFAVGNSFRLPVSRGDSIIKVVQSSMKSYQTTPVTIGTSFDSVTIWRCRTRMHGAHKGGSTIKLMKQGLGESACVRGKEHPRDWNSRCRGNELRRSSKTRESVSFGKRGEFKIIPSRWETRPRRSIEPGEQSCVYVISVIAFDTLVNRML